MQNKKQGEFVLGSLNCQFSDDKSFSAQWSLAFDLMVFYEG